MFKKLFILCWWILAVPMIGHAQAAAPAPATMQVSIGAAALDGNGVPGTDIVAKASIAGALALRSDNILIPSTQFQFYGGGFQYNIPMSFLAKTNFSSLQGYVTASLGADRIVPASGASQAHLSGLAGGGFNWQMSNNVIVNIVEVRWMHAPGNPSGANVPVVSGGFSLFF